MTTNDLDNNRKVKDPDAVLDYFIDWTDHPDGSWLAPGDTISTAVWTITGPDSSLVQASGHPPGVVGGRCTIWLDAGTPGADYEVNCHITTAQGREDDRTLTILVRQR